MQYYDWAYRHWDDPNHFQVDSDVVVLVLVDTASGEDQSQCVLVNDSMENSQHDCYRIGPVFVVVVPSFVHDWENVVVMTVVVVDASEHYGFVVQYRVDGWNSISCCGTESWGHCWTFVARLMDSSIDCYSRSKPWTFDCYGYYSSRTRHCSWLDSDAVIVVAYTSPTVLRWMSQYCCFYCFGA